MKKDKLISFRVPESVYDGICSLAKKQGTSVSQLMKDTIASASWSLELERNREYHRQVLRELDRVEKRLAKFNTGMSRVARKVKV
jgi:hypothetical protein